MKKKSFLLVRITDTNQTYIHKQNGKYIDLYNILGIQEIHEIHEIAPYKFLIRDKQNRQYLIELLNIK